MISHIFKGLGRKVGMTSTDGVVIDERLLIRADASGPRSARMVLQNPRVDFAVFEVARGGILREGLGYERNDVAVVLNVQPDHLGLRGIDTVEQLADVKAVVVEAVPRDGHAVLNADDPLVRAMRRRCSGQVVWFSMAEPGSEVRDMIDAHCRRGGKALVLSASERGEMIVVKHGPREMQLAWTHLLPATFGGRARMNVQNSLAAAAAAFAAGAPLHDIRQGLRTFSTSYYLSPGRLNEVEVNGVNVIVDYCHNAPGMRALGDFVDRVGETLDLDPRARQALADRRHRHGRRPARRGHARARRRSPRSTSTWSSCARTPRCAAVTAARPRGWSRRACAPRWPTAPGASRWRPSSTRSTPSATRWRGPTPATSWCSASTSTRP